MSDQRATGIILRVRPLSDTSLIVHWLTAEHGRLATVAKSARRPASPFHGRLDLAYGADLSFVWARRSTLHPLREVNVTATNPGVRADYAKLLQFAYGVALLEQSTETETPVAEIYSLWADWLGHLNRQPAQARTVYALEARLLERHGLDPLAGSAETLGDDARALLQALLAAAWDEIPELVGAGSTVRALSVYLNARLADAFGRVPEARRGALGRG